MSGLLKMVDPIGRTVGLFLVDGSPTGVVTVEIMNWTGKVLVAPRSRIGEALKRDEADRTGVYCLVGDDPKQPSKPLVDIGEADCFADRIRTHGRDESKDNMQYRDTAGPVTCLAFALAIALALAGGATGAAAQGDCEAMPKGIDRTNCFIIRGRIAKQKSQLAADKARLGISRGQLSGVTGRRAAEPSSAETPPLPERKQAVE